MRVGMIVICIYLREQTLSMLFKEPWLYGTGLAQHDIWGLTVLEPWVKGLGELLSLTPFCTVPRFICSCVYVQ